MKISVARSNVDHTIKMLDLKNYEISDYISHHIQQKDSITINWKSGQKTKHFHTWLRENCACELCRDPSSMEKSLDITSIIDDVCPREIKASEDTLKILWQDGHQSIFDAGWLLAHKHQDSTNEYHKYRKEQTIPSVDYNQYLSNDQVLLETLNSLISFGVVMIENVPTEPNETITVGERISFLRNTNYGMIFDVRSVPNPISGAYSTKHLHPHTDLPNYETPPGFQFFHCIENSAKGRETVLVDGFEIAETLKSEYLEYYDLLSMYPMSFRLLDENNDRKYSGCMIGLDHQKNLQQIRYSRTAIAPFTGSSIIYPAIRRAYKIFSKFVDDPAYQSIIKLEPGQLLITDNYRILHGRKSFDMQTGNRHLQGCYIDRTELLNRKEVLERNIAKA